MQPGPGPGKLSGLQPENHSRSGTKSAAGSHPPPMGSKPAIFGVDRTGLQGRGDQWSIFSTSEQTDAQQWNVGRARAGGTVDRQAMATAEMARVNRGAARKKNGGNRIMRARANESGAAATAK